jgi:flavorubredoxin
MCDRPPLAVEDEPLDIGGHRMRFLPTPHVPHNWESGLWFDETTRTLFAGDLFSSVGYGAPITESDLLEGAVVCENIFHQTSVGPAVAPTIERLAVLQPEVLAVMHGSSFRGNGTAQLHGLASFFAVDLALT